MKKGIVAIWVLFCLAFCGPTHATSNYTYKKGEYVTIKQGRSPNGKFSIAAHGDGEMGYGNFHIYLMREPGHKKIGPLTEIDEILDTGPDAYKALWSPDSRHVAILYRSDRHIGIMQLYRVENGRAFPITEFDALPIVMKRAGLSTRLLKRDNSNEAYFEMRWQNRSRFFFEQSTDFYAPSRQPADVLKAYGRAWNRGDESSAQYARKFIITVSVESVCQLNDKLNTVQIVSTKPGKFP